MDFKIRLLFVMVMSWHCDAEPLSEAMKRKSDAYMSYANNYAHDYGPIAFAAVSLHPPMPVLHIISGAPIGNQQHVAAESNPEYSYASPYAAAASLDSKSVLYARPDMYGGYTYYRKSRLPPKKPINMKKPRPVLLRIHKYRIIRDR